MIGHVAQGQHQLRQVADIVLGLDPKRPWRVEITRHHALRSTEQNRLLWAIYTAIADETGHDADEIHEFCKAKFLPRRVVNFKGTDHEVVGSTALLDKPAFSEYVLRVSSWASNEFGIRV